MLRLFSSKRRIVLILSLLLVLPSCKHRSTAEFISIKDPVADFINEWADQSVDSLKIYENVNRAELSAIVNTAHQRIDNLEHGLAVDTEFFSRKQPSRRREKYFAHCRSRRSSFDLLL